MPLRKLLHQLSLCLGQIKPVHGLGETQVGVDTGDDDARIYREQLDAYKGDTNVDIDHQALVEDGVDDIGEAARRWAIKVSVAGSTLCNGHEFKLSSGPWDWALGSQLGS